MRHFLAQNVLAVLLAVPVAAFGQHHHSSGGLGGLGGLFGGGSSPFQPQHHSQPMFQPQHQSQPAFQPQHHQGNQSMFGGQNGQNRSNGFQQNFQPQPQTHQANRPVTSQPQTGQLNRSGVMNHGTAAQPQVSNSGPALHHHPASSQQGNVSSQSNGNRSSATLSTNSMQGQQGRSGGNSQGTAGVLSNKSNPGNNSGGNRSNGGIGGLTTNASGTAAIGNRTHGGTGVAGNQTVGTNVLGNRSNTNNGTSNNTAVLSNRTGNAGGNHPGHAGPSGTGVSQTLNDAKATALQKAQGQAGNQKSNTGVVQTGESAITNGGGNRNVPQNNPNGPRSNTTGIATNGQRGGAVNANLATAGTSSNTGGTKSLPNTTGGGHTRGHGSLTTGPTDVRKAAADKRAHDIAQQQAIKQRSQSSASTTTSTGKPGGIAGNATTGKTPGNSTSGKTPANSTIANATAGHPGGNSTTANGPVGVKKISTTGQMTNNTSGTQRGQNSTTTKPVGGGQGTGRLAATAAATNASKPVNKQTASATQSGKPGRATVGSSDSSRTQAMSQLPKDKQDSIKNKTTQNNNAAIASQKPVNKNNGGRVAKH